METATVIVHLIHGVSELVHTEAVVYSANTLFLSQLVIWHVHLARITIRKHRVAKRSQKQAAPSVADAA